jgi:uncharacterized protein YjbI with pentapeptide repeats
MADEEHRALLEEGAVVWNEWRAENPGTRPDLSGCDLRRVDLTGSLLNRANLARANLQGVNLQQHDLQAVDFRAANLSGANLDYGFIVDSDLSYACCVGASFVSANLGWAKLIRTDFRHAKFAYTSFCNVDLSTAALEVADYRGPSTVGTDTLIRTALGVDPESRDQHAVEAFLWGCGLDEPEIDSFRRHVQQPPRYRSVFICYCRSDHEFARRLHAALSLRRVHCWLDAEDMVIGTIWKDRIQEAVREHDRVIVCCSKEAMTSSRWVGQEIDLARYKERKTGEAILLPVDIDGYLEHGRSDRAKLIKERTYADFRNWRDDDALEAGISQLLVALQWRKD